MSTEGPHKYAGVTLPGGWRTIKAVGRGNFAWVFEGVSPKGERCAVKILHEAGPQATKRFLREIKIAREIPPSRYCVRYMGHGETADGAPWMAMEFINGVTLTALMAKGRTISTDPLLRLMVQVCRGFAGLHRYGLAHRDVKPDNIMVTRPAGNVKLLDFGLVQDSQGLLKLFEEQDLVVGSDFAEDLDRGMLAGTPEYMAPEQISDAKSATSEQRTDTTADVYSLATIFYELLTGTKLFPFDPKAHDPKELQREIVAYLNQRLEISDDELVRPEAISAPLWSILKKSLRNDPKQRQGTAVELAGDIEVYMATGEGIADDDDMSVTIRGMTTIPEDIIMAAQQFQDRLSQPNPSPDQAPTLTIPERKPSQREAPAPPTRRDTKRSPPPPHTRRGTERSPPPKGAQAPSQEPGASRAASIGAAVIAVAALIGAVVYYLVAS